MCVALLRASDCRLNVSPEFFIDARREWPYLSMRKYMKSINEVPVHRYGRAWGRRECNIVGLLGVRVAMTDLGRVQAAGNTDAD